MTSRLCLVAAALTSTVAWAQDDALPPSNPFPPPAGSPPPSPTAPPPSIPAYGHMGFAIALGAETAFDGEPATLRLTLSGDSDFLVGAQFALALAMPITILTKGEEQDGISFSHTAIELPPSLRLRLLPTGVVRIYADLGLGVVVVLTNSTGDSAWDFDDDETAGFMTRAGFGFEIGLPGSGFMFVIEPLSTRTYYLSGTYGALGVMLGAGARF